MRGQIPKYTPRRWEPRVNQTYACIDWDNIYEGKRREFIDDERMPFVFRNINQVRTAQAFANELLALRKKYNCPALWDKYILVEADGFLIQEWFGSSLFHWYLYDNGFIVSTKVPSEEFTRYVAVATSYLKTIEDLYIDEYWKSKQ